MPTDNPIDQTQLGMAALFACLVKTFNDSDSAFQARFEKHLLEMYMKIREAEYMKIREDEIPNIDPFETLIWMRKFLK
jgi:hypothetical protein